MKKTLLIILIFIFACFSHSRIIFGQESDILLSLTSYTTRDQIDTLFANSTRVLNYFDSNDLSASQFLHLITQDQYQALIKQGFSPKILDAHTDIVRYVLLMPHNKRQELDPSLLTPLGETTILDKTRILLKLAPGKKFTHTGELAGFVEIPFMDAAVLPPLRTKTALAPNSPTRTVKPMVSLLPSALSPLHQQSIVSSVLPLLFVVLFLVTALFILNLWKRKSSLTQSRKLFLWSCYIALCLVTVALIVLTFGGFTKEKTIEPSIPSSPTRQPPQSRGDLEVPATIEL